MRLITKNQQAVSNWSGGTTRQIFIYPEGSDYAARQFDFRISSATVDCESSTFTPLPGVHRHLMILDGTLELVHLDRYKKTLEVLDQDEFEGDWHTLSFGKVVDFNLMLKKGRASIEGIKHYHQPSLFSPEEEAQKADFLFFYLHQGQAEVGGQSLQTGDFLISPNATDFRLSKQLNEVTAVKGLIFLR